MIFTRINKARKYKMHTVIFFIFLVANIGGSLTPLGDPPLFLGFLNGVDFFWTTEKMLYPMLTLATMLLIIYFIIDSYYCKKEDFKGSDDTSKEKIKIEGAFNFLLIGGVVFAVLLSGMDSFKIPVIEIFGNSLLKGNLIRDLILLSLALLSLIYSKDEYRKMNGFTWHPILEVAKLFIGIFSDILSMSIVWIIFGPPLASAMSQNFTNGLISIITIDLWQLIIPVLITITSCNTF